MKIQVFVLIILLWVTGRISAQESQRASGFSGYFLAYVSECS